MQEVFEKIVEELTNYIKDNDAIYDKNQNYNGAGAFLKAIDVIEQVAADYNNGWIPCSERLPEENIEVLVTISEIDSSTYTRTSWVQEGMWVIKRTPLEPTVIAWQPLPEPYVEGE